MDVQRAKHYFDVQVAIVLLDHLNRGQRVLTFDSRLDEHDSELNDVYLSHVV